MFTRIQYLSPAICIMVPGGRRVNHAMASIFHFDSDVLDTINVIFVNPVVLTCRHVEWLQSSLFYPYEYVLKIMFVPAKASPVIEVCGWLAIDIIIPVFKDVMILFFYDVSVCCSFMLIRIVIFPIIRDCHIIPMSIDREVLFPAIISQSWRIIFNQVVRIDFNDAAPIINLCPIWSVITIVI